MPEQEPSTSPDAERRAMLAGSIAAPVLLALGTVIGLVEGGLLPGACQGLACLFSGLVLGATLTIAVVWLLLWAAVRVARRRWPRSTWRLWALRTVAVVSWGPVAWLLILAMDG
jgi:hypothetical protein